LKTSGGLNRRLKDEAPERRWFLPPSAPGGLKEFTDNKIRCPHDYTTKIVRGLMM
jgi:hypothetical protein